MRERKNSKTHIFLIVCLLIASVILVDAGHTFEVKEHDDNSLVSTDAKWTVLYYMCGDSNMDIYIDPLIDKLSTVGSNEDVNIVCLIDKKGYGNSNLVYINEKGQQVTLNRLYGWPDEIDMGNQNTLEVFCMQMMDAFPATYYAFMTYANGGTGWKKYPLDDDDGKGYVTTPELAESLKKITNNGREKIDVLQTSCCMSNIEFSYEIAPYVDYLITTQEHIAEKTIVPRFYKAVWDLKNNTHMSPEEFGKAAAYRHDPHSFQYFESYGIKPYYITKLFNKLPFPGLHTVMMHSSVAIVNLSTIDDLVEAVNTLSSYMLLNQEDKEFKIDIRQARDDVREFGKASPKSWIYYKIYQKLPLEILSYNCRIDLYNFIDLFNNTIEQSLINNFCCYTMEKINESIVELVKMPDDPSYGFNIYFPVERDTYNKNISQETLTSPYEDLKFCQDTYWDEFLKNYLNIE